MLRLRSFRKFCSNASKSSAKPSEKVSSSGAGGEESSKSSGGGAGSFTVLSWKSVLAFGAVALGAGWYYDRERKRLKPEHGVKHMGDLNLGGEWTLVDQDGRAVTSASFRGRFVLLYFGFTFCPDICPAELLKIRRALDQLGERHGLGDEVMPLFVTVDPWRDSVGKVREYLRAFGEDFAGLTGTPEQVRRMARKYRVYSSNTKPSEFGEGDYLVDHSVIKYLLDRDGSGRAVAIFGSDLDEDALAAKIAEEIRQRGVQPKNIGFFSKLFS